MMNPLVQQHVRTRRNTVTRVKRLLIDSLQLNLAEDEIAEDSPLFGFGLGLDSIDALTLLVAVEDHFGIPVSDENMLDFHSVNAIADFVIVRFDRTAAQ